MSALPKEYDIQGQIVNTDDHPVSLTSAASASAQPYSNDSRYAPAGEGTNWIPATAPGLNTVETTKTVVVSQTQDPWNASEAANKKAVESMYGKEAADKINVLGSTAKYEPAS